MKRQKIICGKNLWCKTNFNKVQPESVIKFQIKLLQILALYKSLESKVLKTWFGNYYTYVNDSLFHSRCYEYSTYKMYLTRIL